MSAAPEEETGSPSSPYPSHAGDVPVDAALALAVRSYLNDRRDEMVDLLRRMALAESPTDQPMAQGPMRRILVEQLVEAGCQVQQIPGGHLGDHLLARPENAREGGPTQLLIGHYDTVWPLGTLREMPVRLREGRLHGPGVYDMKGGLTQLIYALRALRELRLRPGVEPVVFLNSDEEIGSPSSTPHIERWARLADRAFILEPAQGPRGQIKTARKGVGHFKVRIRGPAAEPASAGGGSPANDASTVLELARAVQRLHRLNDPERGVSVNVGVISGGQRPRQLTPESVASVDVRAYHEADALEVREAVLAMRPTDPGVRIGLEDWDFHPAMERTPRNRALWEVTRRTGAMIGLRLEETSVGGGSDGNTTSLHTATVDGLGPRGAGSHAAIEHVEVESLPERGTLLALLLLAPPLRGR